MKKIVYIILLIFCILQPAFSEIRDTKKYEELKYCERQVFDIQNGEEDIQCFFEFNIYRYLRIVGSDSKGRIIRNIQLSLSVDPDIVKELSISNGFLSFILDGIEGAEEFCIDLKLNKRRTPALMPSNEYEQVKKIYFGVGSFKTVIIDSQHLINFYDSEYSESHDFWNQSCDYIELSEGKYSVLKIKYGNNEKKLLSLKSSSMLVLYDFDTSQCVFLGAVIPSNTKRTLAECIYFPTVKCASSELKEKTKTYSVSNLASFDLDSPWCEGVEGNGIGEEIELSVNAKKLYFFSGYVSSKKQYLFEANSRPKKITVLFKDKNESKSYFLEDTPNPQVIDFEQAYKGTISIRIDEVYEGNKYQDTCIHCILCQYY